MYVVRIVDQYHYNVREAFGLGVTAPEETWPNVVGCGLHDHSGEIIDQPARWLRSAGPTLWDIRIGDVAGDFRNGPAREAREGGWGGQIIFALSPNDRFTQRLPDTGWVT